MIRRSSSFCFNKHLQGSRQREGVAASAPPPENQGRRRRTRWRSREGCRENTFFGDAASDLRMFPIGAKREAESDSSRGDSSRRRNHWKGNYGLPSGRVPSFWKISTRVAFKNGQDLPAGMKSSLLFFFSFFFPALAVMFICRETSSLPQGICPNSKLDKVQIFLLNLQLQPPPHQRHQHWSGKPAGSSRCVARAGIINTSPLGFN